MKSVQNEVKDFTAISSMKIQRKLTYFRKKSQVRKKILYLISIYILYSNSQNEKKLATSKVVTKNLECEFGFVVKNYGMSKTKTNTFQMFFFEL